MSEFLKDYDKEKTQCVAAEAYVRGVLRGGWYNQKKKTFMFTGSNSFIKMDDFTELKVFDDASVPVS